MNGHHISKNGSETVVYHTRINNDILVVWLDQGAPNRIDKIDTDLFSIGKRWHYSYASIVKDDEVLIVHNGIERTKISLGSKTKWIGMYGTTLNVKGEQDTKVLIEVDDLKNAKDFKPLVRQTLHTTPSTGFFPMKTGIWKKHRLGKISF